MYDQAYIDYLAHFHGTRDYFECHELLEERWKEETPLDKKALWVGLIQLSVSLYHHRRGNMTGALRTANKAKCILTEKRDELPDYGLDPKQMILLMETVENRIYKKAPYQSIELPITDPILVNAVKSRCSEMGCKYGVPSNMEDPQLVHRHSMRDRSDVIEERENELKKRNENRKV